MARRTFFALLAIFSWFFAIFSELRWVFRWVMTVFGVADGLSGRGGIVRSCGGFLGWVTTVFSGWRRRFSLRSLRVSARAREELLPRRPHLRRPRSRGFRTLQLEVAPTQRLWGPAVSRRGHLRPWPGCRGRLEFQRGHGGGRAEFSVSLGHDGRPCRALRAGCA